MGDLSPASHSLSVRAHTLTEQLLHHLCTSTGLSPAPSREYSHRSKTRQVPHEGFSFQLLRQVTTEVCRGAASLWVFVVIGNITDLVCLLGFSVFQCTGIKALLEAGVLQSFSKNKSLVKMFGIQLWGTCRTSVSVKQFCGGAYFLPWWRPAP